MKGRLIPALFYAYMDVGKERELGAEALPMDGRTDIAGAVTEMAVRPCQCTQFNFDVH